ncbi:uncharacterized protein [Rutidosis leptorrhynchoides]|uniref:uncharacterized protein n=1 Tax=Rutidosis leptorrhynchoides TaxID=125765 RepID=UPI003A99C85D
MPSSIDNFLRMSTSINSRVSDPRYPDHVCLLHKSLYRLTQASQAWCRRFSGYAQRMGLRENIYGTLLFIYRKGFETTYQLLYVDDIVLTVSSTSLLHRIITSIHQEFSMTGPGPLNYFLGISATRVLLTLVYSSLHPLLSHWLSYLTLTRLAAPPLDAPLLGIAFFLATTFSPGNLNGNLHPLSPVLRLNIEVLQMPLQRPDGFVTYFASCIILSLQRHSSIVIMSVLFTSHLIWFSTSEPSILIVIHFVRDLVAQGQFRVLHVSSRYQFADIFTKGLLYALFDDFRSSLSVRSALAPTAGMLD